MTSKNSLNKDYSEVLSYLGIAITSDKERVPSEYVDLESFFIWAINNFNSSRFAEGFLCWLKEYGYILSPSKIRKLIKEGQTIDPQVLGGVLSFLETNKIGIRQWAILKIYAKKLKPRSFNPIIPRKPQADFAKYGLLIPEFKLDADKFLREKKWVIKNCLEIRNRFLFGATVNADVASYITKNPSATAFEVSKQTGNHKATVFRIYEDVKSVLMAMDSAA